MNDDRLDLALQIFPYIFVVVALLWFAEMVPTYRRDRSAQARKAPVQARVLQVRQGFGSPTGQGGTQPEFRYRLSWYSPDGVAREGWAAGVVRTDRWREGEVISAWLDPQAPEAIALARDAESDPRSKLIFSAAMATGILALGVALLVLR